MLWLAFVHKFINESCKKQHRVSPNTNIFSSPDMSLNKRHHQLRKLQHRPVWKMCFKSSNTVDGSEIRRSPVEVGSLFPSIYKVLAPSQVVQEFFTNNIGAFHFLSWSYVGPRLFTPEIVKVNRVPLRKQNEYMFYPRTSSFLAGTRSYVWEKKRYTLSSAKIPSHRGGGCEDPPKSHRYWSEGRQNVCTFSRFCGCGKIPGMISLWFFCWWFVWDLFENMCIFHVPIVYFVRNVLEVSGKMIFLGCIFFNFFFPRMRCTFLGG